MKSDRRQSAPGLLSWCWPLLLLALSACGGGGDAVPPQIAEFAAEPSSVTPGETVLLHWQVDHLNDGLVRLEALSEGDVEPASLGEVTAQSSTAVRVEETTTFRLIAAGAGGTASKEATVSVVAPPPDPPQIAFFRTVDSGEGVTLEWEVSGADSVRIEPPGVEMDQIDLITVDPCATTNYTLIAQNAGGSERASLTVEVEPSDCLLFLIAGQSNASGFGAEAGGEFPVEGVTEEPEEGVMMLDPSNDWVLAEEPTHEGGKHSFLVRFGKEVEHETGKRVFLVPTAVPGSALHDWQPGDEHFDDAIDMAEHASESLGIPVSAIIWYQGESDTKTESRREDFVDHTDDVLEGLRAELDEPPVIFVQLSKRLWSQELNEPGDNIQGHNLAYQVVREQQRLMEADALTADVGDANESDVDRPYYFMVVAHDLPMSDAKHLSGHGQRVLGTRIAKLYLTCIDSECAAPPGPRLQQLTVETTPLASTVLVELSEPVTAHPTYDDYFAVFVDGSERSGLTISQGVDQSIIRLELATPVPAGATVEVRYMPPEGTPLFEQSVDVVKDLDDGLPLPAFGMPVEKLPCEDPGGSCSFPGLRLP